MDDLTRPEGLGAERWRRVELLFHRTLELEERERRLFLEEACGEDAGLRHEVERLLAQDSTSSQSFAQKIDQAVGMAGEEGPAAAPPGPPDLPDDIHGYRVVALLGEGGMGTVYRAEQEGPIRRSVALKVTRPGIGNEAVRRFESERQVLARMQHPNIAQVFEAGWTGSERPFFAMELVDGDHITTYCDRHRLHLETRLRLFSDVCRAIQHAHQKGIIHRDLKPSNILVMDDGDRPLPKVIDFGIAKAIDPAPSETTLGTGQRLLGTPGYLSPEALEGRELDTRSDLYSLGVVLFRLLLGVPPFEDEVFPRWVRRVVEEDPPSLARRAESLTPKTLEEQANSRSLEPKALIRHLDGDLGWIVAKAIARQPQDRYPSAAELASEIERFLRHEPVLAGPPTATYRLRKLVRRHTLAFASAILVVLSLLGGLIARTFEAERANREAERANLEAQNAEQVTDFLIELFASTNPLRTDTTEVSGPGRPGDTPVRVILERGADRIESELASQPLAQARMMSVMAGVYSQLNELDRARNFSLRATEQLETHLGADHLDLAESLDQLGWIDETLDPELAAEHFQRALEIRRRLLGAEHPLLAHSLLGLGFNLRTRGDLEGAAKHFLRAVDLLRRGPETPQLAQGLVELGLTALMQGRYTEGEAHLREALEVQRRILGDRHSYLARTLRDLGLALSYQGRYLEAEPHFRESLGLLEERYGEDHSMVADLLQNLGGCYRSQGRIAEAEPLLRRALEILPQGDPQYFTVLNDLGLLLLSVDRADASVEAFRRVVESLRQDSEDHPTLQISLGNLGLALHAAGQLDEAEEALRESLARYRRAVDDSHSSLGLSCHNLSRTLFEQGQVDEGEALVLEALAIFERAFPAADYPDGHWRRSNSESLLGAYQSRRGDFAQAESLLLPALAAIVKAKGENDWYTRDVLLRIVDLYGAWGREDPSKAALADPYRQRLVAAGWLDSAEDLGEQD